MDELGLKRYCCRRMILTHVDLVDKLLSYQVGLPRAGCAARLCAGQRPAVLPRSATRPRPPRARRHSRRRRPRRASGDEASALFVRAADDAASAGSGALASRLRADRRTRGLDGRGRASALPLVSTRLCASCVLPAVCGRCGPCAAASAVAAKGGHPAWRPAPAHCREPATSDGRRRAHRVPARPGALDPVCALGRSSAAGDPQQRGPPQPAPFAESLALRNVGLAARGCRPAVTARAGVAARACRRCAAVGRASFEVPASRLAPTPPAEGPVPSVRRGCHWQCRRGNGGLLIKKQRRRRRGLGRGDRSRHAGRRSGGRARHHWNPVV